MSTRSFIARQIGEDQYRTVYCHSDGYLTYNGAMLLDHYNTPEKVDELLALGNLSLLNEKLYPNPNKPHGFAYDKRQEDVTVAYGRDRGDKDTQAKTMTLAKLDDPNNWTAYVYIFTRDNTWKYFHAGHSAEGLRDVKEDLAKEYAAYGIERPQGYYGFLSDAIARQVREEQVSPDGEQTQASGPGPTM